MIFKIMVGKRGEQDIHRRIWCGANTPVPEVAWTPAKKKTSRDTKYATLELMGWHIEFHELNNASIYNKWLMVRRAADKTGPAFREAKLRLRRVEEGGTLVLKLKSKTATAELQEGDLSAKFWDEQMIDEVRTLNSKCPLINRIFANPQGQIRRVWRIYAGGSLKQHCLPGVRKPEAFNLGGSPWALVLSVDNQTGKDLHLTLYTTCAHAQTEQDLERFLRQHALPSFIVAKSEYAAYDDE